MGYRDDWELECVERWAKWSSERLLREIEEDYLSPDERLDEVGWDISYCAVARGMRDREAARLAMEGTYRQRLRVREDMFRRLAVVQRRRYVELHPAGVDLNVWETHAPEQLRFWESRLASASYVYFIQDGNHGPVKIGLSNRPVRRAAQLQTGNPEELLLRHVIPGDRRTECQQEPKSAPGSGSEKCTTFGVAVQAEGRRPGA
jgi:hypothetical protein